MSNAEKTHKAWNPSLLFQTGQEATPPDLAVILLNQAISPAHRKTFKTLWEHASLRLCADGGANRLYDEFKDDIALPHEIRGDLDSLRDDVKDYYSRKHVNITKAASQYATDLQKCILKVEEYEDSNAGVSGIREMDVVVLGGLSGRFDQTMHTLHVLCQIAETESNEEASELTSIKKTKNKGIDENDFVTLERRKRAWVLSDNSLVWILSKGSHIIAIDHTRFGPTCGLIPFASQVSGSGEDRGPRIWTNGLEWDLDGRPSAIGNFLSTSNHLKEDTVHVTTDAEVVWTMELREG